MFVLEVIAKHQGAVSQGCAKGSASSVPKDSDLEGESSIALEDECILALVKQGEKFLF